MEEEKGNMISKVKQIFEKGKEKIKQARVKEKTMKALEKVKISSKSGSLKRTMRTLSKISKRIIKESKIANQKTAFDDLLKPPEEKLMSSNIFLPERKRKKKNMFLDV